MKIKQETENAAGGGRAVAIPVSAIAPARHNVHAEERRGDETFRGLVGSIRANGLIHRIVVRPDPDRAGRYVIVDGHRRYEAAKAAGMDEVPCEVRDCDEGGALAVTVAANVQRLENDPVLEAEAIGRLMKAGRTARDIAAAIGKSEAYVARRSRLTTLAEPWREFAKRVRCTVAMLERVAAHETAVQERVAANAGLDEYEEDGGDPCGWAEFESAFAAETRRLDEAKFDVAGCAKCPNNTACHAYLFDWMADEEGNAPRCQDAVCYAKKSNDAVDAKVAELRRAGRPATEVDSKWSIPAYWDVAEERDRKHPQAYVYEQDGIRHLVWGLPKRNTAEASTPAKTAVEREAERAEKRRRRFAKSAREKVRTAVTERARDVGAFRRWAGALYADLAARRLDRELGGTWIDDGLVDDIARTWPELGDICELTTDESDALVEELRAADEREARYAEAMRAEADGDADGESEGGEE